MRRYILSISLLFVLNSYIFSQQFGGNPPSLKWKQINTDSARVIFPQGLDSQAQRVAGIVHYLAKQKPFSPGDKIYKINIVLQNQTTISNGYVGLGPYRSEFYMTPDPNNFEQGSQAWPDQLAVHEYRHVMQYNNFRNGLSKAFYYLFGEEGLSIAIDGSVPNWFFEGDAVYNETFTTHQGRGRLPFFLNAYPSLWMSGKHYSFMKLRNGSLKDYVPNHYNLGYMLVNYGREKYGVDFWNKVTYDASAYKGLFYPFQHAIKKYAGVDYRTFYNNAFDYYKKIWNIQNDKNSHDYVSKPTYSYVTDYQFPYQIGHDSLLYLKSSYVKIPHFVIKDKSGEHSIRAKDISNDMQFSYRNGRIVYAGYETDARWAWRDYSVIKVLNIYNKRQVTITHKTKYFTPDISEDGSQIVAVQNSSDGKSVLHILNASDGKVVKEISSAEVNVFTDPKFVDENNLVAVVRLRDGKSSLASIDIKTGSIERLTPPSFSVAGYPCVTNGIVYFTASYSGNDDVFAVRLSDKKIFQVSNDHLGNYYANVSGDKAIVSHFTADGYQLKRLDASISSLKEMDLDKPDSSNAGGQTLLEQTPHRIFPVSNYNKATKLVNFHSWRPYYEDPDFTFSLYGENVLNTFQTQLYYHYNNSDKTNGVGFSGTFGALFPYINFGTEYTFDVADSSGGHLREWSQLDTRIGLNVPFDFSRGLTYKFLNIGTDYVLRNDFIKAPSKQFFPDFNFTYLHHYISWQHTVQTARQHIYPRLGYTLSIDHRYPVDNFSGYQFLGRASLYLPGFYSTHTIVLSGAFQQRDTSRVIFSNGIAGARGYSDYYRTDAGSRLWRLSANYHLPLFIPDWGFGQMLYIQRIRANAFYDFQRIFSNDKLRSLDLRSTGAELYFDTKWWNQYPLTFGIRFSHLLDQDILAPGQTNVIELILPTSIIPK
ncbi:MAG: hypothetical protein QM764_00590 [Chitinophagaceae bacterium]